MKLKSTTLSLIAVALFVSAASAQTDAVKTPPEIPKIVRGGVVNGKAVELVRPKYPAAARAVRASGTVNVQVTIDEQGAVIAAEAVSGHPLLRAAAIEAAKASRFSPTRLSGQPVKVTGVIVYNFISDMSMIEIGYEMALAERSADAVRRLPISQIMGNLPKDWTEENDDLGKLSRQLFRTPSPKRPPEVNKEAPADTNVGTTSVISEARSEGRYTTGNVAPVEPEIEDTAAFVKSVRVKMESKFGIGDVKGWYFGLGLILAKMEGELDTADRITLNFDELNRHVLAAPLNASKAILNEARAIAESGRNADREGFKETVRAQIKALKNSSLAQ